MTKKTTNECIKCGTALDTTPRPGRPARYCGKACRRAAEFELRRLTAAIETLEDRARWGRINGDNPRSQQRFAVEIDNAERRLRALLAASEGEDQ